jgi:hypothetical protein
MARARLFRIVQRLLSHIKSKRTSYLYRSGATSGANADINASISARLDGQQVLIIHSVVMHRFASYKESFKMSSNIVIITTDWLDDESLIKRMLNLACSLRNSVESQIH